MSRLLTTTKSEPNEPKVHRRIVRDVGTGKVIDDCIPDIVADEKLFRELPEKRNLRVEVVMKDAAKWFRHSRPDISEIYSLPRIAQVAGLWLYAGTTSASMVVGPHHERFGDWDAVGPQRREGAHQGHESHQGGPTIHAGIFAHVYGILSAPGDQR